MRDTRGLVLKALSEGPGTNLELAAELGLPYEAVRAQTGREHCAGRIRVGGYLPRDGKRGRREIIWQLAAPADLATFIFERIKHGDDEHKEWLRNESRKIAEEWLAA